MSLMRLDVVYEVPIRSDEEGGIWYKCLSDMHFANSRVGWVVGSGQVLYTKDGGRTWGNQYGNFANEVYLNPNRVFAINPKTCWIISIGSSTDIRCSYTRDGGVTWKGKEFETEIHPNDIFFADSKRGWIISDNGHWPAHEGMIHFTNDGGEKWEGRSLGIKGKPKQLRFISTKKGCLLEDYLDQGSTSTSSNIHMTDDGGRSWHLIKSFDRSINDLYTLDENRLFVTGECGFIARTIDSGRNWRRLETKSRACINSVAFYNRKRGFAVSGSNALLTSSDGGETWEKIKSQKDYPGALKAHCVSEVTGILVSTTSIYLFRLS